MKKETLSIVEEIKLQIVTDILSDCRVYDNRTDSSVIIHTVYDIINFIMNAKISDVYVSEYEKMMSKITNN